MEGQTHFGMPTKCHVELNDNSVIKVEFGTMF